MNKGNPWISVAQEGDGTSLWLPSKDIWNDEPDEGIEMKIITPKDLTGVGNGKLISQTSRKGKMFSLGKSKNLSIFTALFLPLENLNIFLKFMMAKKVNLIAIIMYFLTI